MVKCTQIKIWGKIARSATFWNSDLAWKDDYSVVICM